MTLCSFFLKENERKHEDVFVDVFFGVLRRLSIVRWEERALVYIISYFIISLLSCNNKGVFVGGFCWIFIFLKQVCLIKLLSCMYFGVLSFWE